MQAAAGDVLLGEPCDHGLLMLGHGEGQGFASMSNSSLSARSRPAEPGCQRSSRRFPVSFAPWTTPRQNRGCRAGVSGSAIHRSPMANRLFSPALAPAHTTGAARPVRRRGRGPRSPWTALECRDPGRLAAGASPRRRTRLLGRALPTLHCGTPPGASPSIAWPDQPSGRMPVLPF